MSDQPPKSPVFDNAPGGAKDLSGSDSIAMESEKERLARLKEELPKLLAIANDKEGGRAQRFYPYVLIRSVVGDRGNRPINVPFWESPDIWTAVGDPATTPAVPATSGGTALAGVPNTVYAHVWNLGRAPIAGVKVEWYWFNPSLGIDGAHANLIGFTRTDLAPRGFPGSHTLVKCPQAWVPVMENGGHECLVARVSAIGDAISAAHGWDSWADRHVAQRNIAVVQTAMPISMILRSLDATRFRDARVQLLQVGSQATQAIQLVAPDLKVDPAVRTHVLAELSPEGRIFLPWPRPDVPAALPAIHPLAPAEIFPSAAPTGGAIGATGPLEMPRVVPHTLLDTDTPAAFPGVRPAFGGGPAIGGDIPLLHTGGNVLDLVRHGTLLSPELVGRLTQLAPPALGQAQVLRVASYRGDQLVGGYTIVVRGS